MSLLEIDQAPQPIQTLDTGTRPVTTGVCVDTLQLSNPVVSTRGSAFGKVIWTPQKSISVPKGTKYLIRQHFFPDLENKEASPAGGSHSLLASAST